MLNSMQIHNILYAYNFEFFWESNILEVFRYVHVIQNEHRSEHIQGIYTGCIKAGDVFLR